jgi:inhibitor of KinA sporulation pathway (predicted exonuclease)
MNLDYLIVDLEANTKSKASGNISEIIQFSGCLLSDINFNKEIKTYESFIKASGDLNRTIRKLTGIISDDLANAPSLNDFVKLIQLDLFNSVIFVSFSDNDIRLFLHNCSKYNIEVNWIEGYIDLQAIVKDVFNIGQNPSLLNSLSLYNLEFSGEHHNASDDMKNTVKLFNKIVKENGISVINQYLKNKDQFTKTFNSIVVKKNDKFVVTDGGKFILGRIYQGHKGESIDKIMHSKVMCDLLKKNFINPKDKVKLKAIRRFLTAYKSRQRISKNSIF